MDMRNGYLYKMYPANEILKNTLEADRIYTPFVVPCHELTKTVMNSLRLTTCQMADDTEA